MPRNVAKFAWVVVVAGFIALGIYNYVSGNYRDLLLSMILVIFPLSLFIVFYLFRAKK